MQKNKTNYIKHGSLTVALFAILLAMSVYIPFLGFLAFIVPLPIAWYSASFERKQAILVTAFAIIISLIIAVPLGFVFGILQATLGYIIGDAIRSKKTKLYMLMASGIFLLLSLALLYIISVLTLNINVLEHFLKIAEMSYKEAGNIMSSAGQLPKDYDEFVTQILLLIEAIMPTYFIGGTFIAAFIYLSINLTLLKKLKLEVPKFSKFVDFRLPKAVLWYYLIVSIFTLFVSFEIGTFGYLFFVNAALILRALLFLQGVSLIHYYFNVQGWPKWTAILATFLAVPLYTFTIILGVLDLGFKIRGFVKDRYKK